MKTSSLVIAALLVIASCGPVVNPVSVEYPCGPKGIVCAHHKCCWRDDECGGVENGSLSCPADTCCFVGDPSSLVGASARPTQHPMALIKTE